MTAKPQPMAGQSDAADDLIAELAKLMAQDAQGERPAQPAVPTFSVRIPGDEADKATPRPTDAPSSPVFRTPHAAEQPNQAAPADEAPEPFHFDFGLGGPKPQPEVPKAPLATAVQPKAPEPVTPHVQDAVFPPDAPDHDSIADLIAAELSGDPELAPQPAAPTPTPRMPTLDEASSNAASKLGGDAARAEPVPRFTNPQPTPRAEQDQFRVPPVFGLGTTPASNAPIKAPTAPDFSVAPAKSERQEPAVHRPVTAAPVAAATVSPPETDQIGNDPIDEIESLIGRAMRVEFHGPEAAEKPAPSPALRSLATPTVPTEPPAPAPHALSAADEAIFAAAQASGAQIGWVEAPEVSELEPVSGRQLREPSDRAPRAFGMTRALAGPLVAITLLLAAGIGLYWVLGLGRESGPAPLLTADATPVKETPVVEPESTSQQSVVFNEMDGVVPGAEEQLVSRDQTDLNEVTQVPTTPAFGEEGLANRKVRTVTVRPDGTIVSGEESLAGNAILPVDRPNVPVVPGAETAIPDLIASAQAEPIPTPAATPEPVVPVTPVPTVTPAQPGSTVPAVDAGGNPLAGKTAVIPRVRPATFAQPASPLPAPVTAEIPQATPVATTTPSGAIPAGATEVEALGNDAPAYVQLASQRSEADARASASALVSRFGPLFGGANMEVQRVDLGAKGIYYRVRVPASSMQQANTICTNVKAAGGDCFTM